MKRNQSGHFHFIIPLVILVLVAGIGYLVYQQSHKPSKVTDAATKAALKQTSEELKQINLAQIKQTADAVSTVQKNFNYQKANGK